jgi:hypothetical protein
MGRTDQSATKRARKHKFKEFNFVPNKYQITHGAFLDLAKKKSDKNLVVARMIAGYNGEEI